MSDTATVIVGASHAGVQCALTLRRLAPDKKIVLLESDRNLPYERPPLSKSVLAGGPVAQIRKAAFYEKQNIDLRLGTQVQAIDRANGRVDLQDGQSIAYENLLLATGATPRFPAIPGIDLDGVRTLRVIDDAIWLASCLTPGSRLVVVGGGFIGLEAAAAAAKAKVHVTVIEAADRVLARVTSKVVSHYFEKLHAANGVEICLGTSLRAIEGHDGKVRTVLTSNNARLQADAVLIGIGVVPRQELAVAAGLDCDDGIKVDRFCRTSDQNIFAAGDVTRHENLMVGRQLRLECIQNAMSQGAVAASNMCGVALEYNEVPWFWTEQFDTRMQSAGVAQPDDQVLVRGDPNSDRFSVLYLKDRVLVAIDTVNNLSDFASAKRLILGGLRIDPAQAGDPAQPLVNIV